MIKHEQTDCGGSVTVKSREGMAFVDYTLSNPDKPLWLSAFCSSASAPRLVQAVVESLCERNSPVIVTMGSKHTEIRYTPKIGRLMRVWGNDRESVYAEAFTERNLFNRVCSFSNAMKNTDIIRAEEGQIDFYEYRSVLNEIRSNNSPFMFLTIKEDFDYTLRNTSAGCVGAMIRAAEAQLHEVNGSLRQSFTQALQRISDKQDCERGYDTKYAYIGEFCSCVLLPAVVKLGIEHPFTQRVFEEFSRASSTYISECNRIVGEYLDTTDADEPT